MNIRSPVLVVVDMQNGFLNDNSIHVVPSVLAAIDLCAENNIPSVYTKFINSSGSPLETLLDWPNVRESPEIDLHGPILGRAEVIIEKHFYTAFTDEFDDLVRANNWRTLIICGVSTESCVLKTAVDTFERDLLPIVIADACASGLGTRMHDNALRVLEVMIGRRQMTTLADLFPISLP